MKKDIKKTDAKLTEQKVDVDQLLLDLQRTRADFENYRKNVDARVAAARIDGAEQIIKQLLPIIDDIERATEQSPVELSENSWAQGVMSLNKKMDAMLADASITKINATPGTKFDPYYHDAVQVDESADGDTEIIESEMQPGYLFHGEPIRHAMVSVTRK